MKVQGFTGDGSRLEGEGEGLRGAMEVVLGREAVTASREQIRSECRWLLGKVVDAQGGKKGRRAQG